MRITKFGHACVRVEYDGGAVVLDPGGFTGPEAVDGATAVLITHEHADHYDVDHLRRTQAPVFTIQAVADRIREDAPDVFERTTAIAPGLSFDVGLPVTAVGELHAVIHPEIPRITNCGYVLEADGTSVFHPGDALTAPDRPVDVLLAVCSAPWARSAELIDFMREVKAPSIVPVHDRVYSDIGASLFDAQVERLVPSTMTYRRLKDGEDL
jgi:L-ascorbate metabolism protein UlaG (beta-lactamase superfamily)